MEVFPVIFLFIAALGITVVLFGGFVVVTIAKLVIRGLNALASPRPVQQFEASTGWTCHQNGCRATNPTHARFCRRCGRAAAVQQQVRVRRAAAMI